MKQRGFYWVVINNLAQVARWDGQNWQSTDGGEYEDHEVEAQMENPLYMPGMIGEFCKDRQ